MERDDRASFFDFGLGAVLAYLSPEVSGGIKE